MISALYSVVLFREFNKCFYLLVFLQPGITLPEDKAYSDLADSDIPLKQASMLVNYLYTLLNNTSHYSSVPDTLTRSFHDVITGLSRLTIFNSYVRIPPLVWKMGWGDDEHGKELPPLPIDILREKDVLQDFVLRVHSIGEFLVFIYLILFPPDCFISSKQRPGLKLFRLEFW